MKAQMLAVLLLASFGLTEHCVVHAQDTKPAETTKEEQSAVQSASHSDSSTPLVEAPSAVQLANSAASGPGNVDTAGDGERSAAVSVVRPERVPRHVPPAREVAIEGFASYGNWQIFAAGESEALYTAGIEYDRNSWGRFAGAQMDYVAEVLPFVLLRQPRVIDEWGHRLSKDNVLLPGFGFSPIGLRMLWRSNKAFKPYFNVKGGAVAFSQKALSPDASYYAFSLAESVGFYVRMSDRWDMRVGLFGDYHFSNAYITSYNPGLDVMNSSIAFSYHLRGTRGVK